ncbi:hypothetical protein A6041_04735 [[Haemophilus] ducreyi]|uniref:hypothetical protein n=1 Tax=Haemophilus ducreyi TaxID=730 RepID=UPI0007CE02F0|nr:hypothetical protein [[Haemophilus] ducreyi]ANF67884.1 hypothetical protein A6041_04735 [[Haemophilus] ducreyi]ANF69553.1 hypothetical protein A6042_06370 [[Haemophilus] ducreyi]
MLKETDLIEGHKYIAKTGKITKRLLGKREIFKIYPDDGLVTYCEVKERRNKCSCSIVATLKTVSIKSFLRWAGKDITKE